MLQGIVMDEPQHMDPFQGSSFEGPAYGKKIAGPPPVRERQRNDIRQPLLS